MSVLAFHESIARNDAIGRVGLVDDIASAVSFLAGDEAGFITGQILYVDGEGSL